MADLRWILLLVGLAFLAALAAWESRRPRQGRRDALNPTDRGEPAVSEREQTDAASVSAPVSMPSVPIRASFNNARVRVMVPVRVDLPPLDPEDAAEIEHFSAHGVDLGTDLHGGEAGHEDVHIDGPLVDGSRVDASRRGRVDEPLFEPALSGDPRSDHPPSDRAYVDDPRVDEQWPITAALAQPLHPRADEAMALPDSRTELPMIHAHESASQASDSLLKQQPVTSAAPLKDIAQPAAEPTAEPIVEWPPESQRHVISVRVVGVNSDRMSGRPLRQALAACGFVHGRFGIFHQPGVDGRALVSAANLNKPGVFDPVSMDFQRFRGLGLFAVLPGPLPPAAALDHLLDTAGDLAQRLHARLLDEQGQPLDEERLEALARTVHGMSNSMLRSEPAA